MRNREIWSNLLGFRQLLGFAIFGLINLDSLGIMSCFNLFGFMGNCTESQGFPRFALIHLDVWVIIRSGLIYLDSQRFVKIEEDS